MKREELLAWRIQLENQIEAIDNLIGLLDSEAPQKNGSVSIVNLPNGKVRVESKVIRRQKTLIEAVEDAANALNSNFTSAEVISFISRTHPHLGVMSSKRVSSPLNSLMRKRKIEYEAKGNGNQAHVYRRVHPQEKPA